MKSGEQEVLVDSGKIKEGDTIIVHMGNVVPFDGIVSEGEEWSISLLLQANRFRF